MLQILGALNVMVAVLVIGVSLPLLLKKIPPNRWYGARFKRAFASESLWYDINAFSAKWMIVWSCAILVVGALAVTVSFRETILTMIALAACPLLLIVPAIQAYLYSKRLSNDPA